MINTRDVLRGFIAISLVLAAARAAAAQAPAGPLTLEQVLRLAEDRSEAIAAAAAAVRRAQGEQARARSDLFPQLNVSASYDRALASEFEGVFDSIGPPCPPFSPDPAGSIESRVAEIERALDCGAVGGGFFGGGSSGAGQNEGQNGGQNGSQDGDEAALPFGREHTWRVNLAFSQNLFSAGRIGAQRDVASAGRDAADLALDAARAQLLFDATQAYFDAALSDRLIAIAEETVRQADITVQQAQLRYEAGTQPEFELLRARVARQNLTPQVIAQRANRQIAYLRLKQLLELPPDAEIELAAGLNDAALPPPAFAPRLIDVEAEVTKALSTSQPIAQTGELAPDAIAGRVAVRQADAAVRLRQAAVRLAEAQGRPSVSLTSVYGRVAYPSGLFPGWDDFRSNWTIGAALQWPIFTGGRQSAEEAMARADLDQQQQQLRQVNELAALDSRSAWAELVAARAGWEASGGTIAQATRAYEIAETRYAAGVSTQLELADARLLLVQAEANRAQAARDLQVARARIALLPNLPLPTGAPVQPAARPAAPMAAPAPAGPANPQRPGGGFVTNAASGTQTGGAR